MEERQIWSGVSGPAIASDPVFFVLGPCAFESFEHCVGMAEALRDVVTPLGRDLMFKCSFDKANRTKGSSFRGAGIQEAMRAFDHVRHQLGIPVVTDVHETAQCDLVAPHVDMLQIPAFLCRQTDLLLAAARTGRPVNIKKGQFLSPGDLVWAVEKVIDAGGTALVCERGTFFGYGDLVVDFRSIRIMRDLGVRVVFDATHSVQRPGAGSGATGGDRRFVHDLARAAISIGVSGLFMEIHDAPDTAPSDGPNMVPLNDLDWRLRELIELDDLTKAASVTLTS